ncbi:MAG: hypothetical protein QE271_00065 [Bacteriovoracaceae bacterium]|nr:hypothetical protein [Bacteriovoracaceae bacterium]
MQGPAKAKIFEFIKRKKNKQVAINLIWYFTRSSLEKVIEWAGKYLRLAIFLSINIVRIPLNLEKI